MNDLPRKPVWKVQFGLRRLLIVAPLAAAALAFAASRFIRHNEVTVQGFLMIRDPRTMVDYWQIERGEVRNDLMERTSDAVLSRAIGLLTPSTRAWIEAKRDPVVWLRSNVHMRTIGAGELIQVAIFRYAPTEDEITAETEIVNALMRSFDDSKEIVFMGKPMSFPRMWPSRVDPGQYITKDFPDVEVVKPAEVERPGWF